MIDLLVDRGACIDDRDKDGGAPLHAAAFMNNLVAASRLLARGAARDARDDLDRRPVDEATSGEMVQLLGEARSA